MDGWFTLLLILLIVRSFVPALRVRVRALHAEREPRVARGIWNAGDVVNVNHHVFAARRVVIDNLDALPHGSDGFRRRIAGIVVVILFVRVAHVDVDIHATLGADDGDAPSLASS